MKNVHLISWPCVTQWLWKMYQNVSFPPNCLADRYFMVFPIARVGYQKDFRRQIMWYIWSYKCLSLIIYNTEKKVDSKHFRNGQITHESSRVNRFLNSILKDCHCFHYRPFLLGIKTSWTFMIFLWFDVLVVTWKHWGKNERSTAIVSRDQSLKSSGGSELCS